MDTTVCYEPEVPKSDDVASTVGEKRPGENEENGDLMVRSVKKQRCGEEMKRVAEIVLVLSAMGRMRGGKSPTEAELGLMAEARAKLAEMCEQFAPKDIVGRDAIGAVIEDLGLNGKLKDQRLGFRAPRLTISEKLSLAKRKIEESKKYPAPSTAFTSHMSQPGVAAGAERPGLSPLGSATHTVSAPPSDKTNHASVSSRGFPATSPYGNAASNVYIQNHWPSNEVKAPTASAAIASSHYTRDSSGLVQPRVKPDEGSTVLTGASQGQAISSANHPIVNASAWSVQTRPAFLDKPTAENKVSYQNSIREADQSFRAFITQTAPGNFTGANQLVQGMNFTQPSSSDNNHAEIAKNIQKLLQPRVRQNPTWNPPSREYMNKAMTCQICLVTISDVESVLICDACEKGYHLRCLQANNLKGIPKFEWHCTRCVQLSNGKPFPPKYGRVMRSMHTSKFPPTTTGVQLPAEKKVGAVDVKVNQQKTSVNASPVLQGPAGFSMGTSKSSLPKCHTETAKPMGNASAIVTLNVAANATSNAAMIATGNSTSAAALNATANAAVDSTSVAAPNATSSSAAYAVSDAAPNTITDAAPDSTSDAAPDATTDAAPDALLSAAPKAISSAELSAATSGATPNAVVNVTSNGTGERNSSEQESLSETQNAEEKVDKDVASSNTDMEQRTTSAICADKFTESSETHHPAPFVAPSTEQSDQNIKTGTGSSVPPEKSPPQTEPPASLSNTVPNNKDAVQAGQSNHAENPLNDATNGKNSENTCERRDGEVKDDQQAVMRENTVGSSEPSIEVQRLP